MIKITRDISVGEDELVFKTSRSSGPGGQNVNKVSTRVTLLFNVTDCKSLSEVQKQRILSRLAGRADKRGVLRVVCQRHRTQKANRRAAVERLQQLLADALKRRAVRKATKVPYAVDQRRLDRKKQRGMLKRQRAQRNLREDFAD
ncbi:MAG: alternative ribosome rescue aminoacyl-tRNA hydrolase ArfB [Sedimentisphaerales bacterium]